MRFLSLGIAGALLFAGCNSTNDVNPHVVGPQGQVSSPIGDASPTAIKITVTIPAAAAGAKSISLSANGASPVVRNIGSGAPGCTGSGTVTCVFTMSAPVGADVFAAKTFAGPSGTGTQLSSASFDSQVASNGSLSIVLGGTVHSLGVALANASPLECSGTFTIPVRVTAKTSTGAVIVGTYSPAVTLNDSDKSAATHVSPATVSSSTTAISVTYNGFVIPNAVISASASGALSGNAVLTPGQLLYTTNFSAVNIYVANASGNAAPLRRITGANTTLSGFLDGVTHDNKCNVYVSSFSPPRVVRFANGANGNVAPVATITGKNTLLNGPYQMVTDASGNLFVANTGTSSVLVVAPNANGNVAPIRNITTNATCSGDGAGMHGDFGVALDSLGDIYASSENQNDVCVFAPTANGITTPIRGVGGSNTGMHATFGPQDIAIGPGDKLYVSVFSSSSHWLVFAANANGNVAPLQNISQPQGQAGVAVDRNGLIYISLNGATIDVYAANATGNAAPIRTISGANTKLQNPTHLSI